MATPSDSPVEYSQGRKRRRIDRQELDASSVFDYLSPKVNANLRKQGITSPLPTQQHILPLLLPGHARRHNGDICFQAPTGSGKTLAYVLPLIESLKDHTVTRLRSAIVLPTRDLVKQVHNVFETCAAGTGLKIGTATGNQTLQAEREILVHTGRRYDPKGHASLLERAKRRLLYFDLEIIRGSESLLDNIDDILPDHVPEYTSNVDVLICTPGRLVQHLRTTTGFTLDDLKWLVIDEVDSLLDQSFQEWVEHVVDALEKARSPDSPRARVLSKLRQPRRARQRYVQKIVLTATIGRDLWALKPLKLRRPRLEVIDGLQETRHIPEQIPENQSVNHGMGLAGAPDADVSEEEAEASKDLEEYAISVGSGSRKPLYLLRLLEFLLPAKTLVFCNSTEGASRLHRLLTILHPPFAPILALATSNSASSLKDIAAFRTGRKTVLIATDRVSRGLDIANLVHVVNYDVPNRKVGNYTHRVGRTARAGNKGKAWSLVSKAEERHFWTGIALTRKLEHPARTIEKYKLDIDDITEEQMKNYEEALSQLKVEAFCLGRTPGLE